MPIIISPDAFDDSQASPGPHLEALLLQLKDYLRRHYKPVDEPTEADCHFTTEEIHANLLRVLPDACLISLVQVAAWLSELNFTFYDYGNMRLEWMMKKV